MERNICLLKSHRNPISMARIFPVSGGKSKVMGGSITRVMYYCSDSIFKRGEALISMARINIFFNIIGESPFILLINFTISFVYCLYLILGFINISLNRAVLIYNRRLGLPVDYSAFWNKTRVSGKYVEGWTPPLPGEGPEMKDSVVYFIFENTQSDWWVFLYFLLLFIALCLLNYFRTKMKDKVLSNENVSLNEILWNKRVFHFCSFFLVSFFSKFLWFCCPK